MVYFSVVNSEHAITLVQDYLNATNMLAQTTRLAVLGQHDLDERVSDEKISALTRKSILDAQTGAWESR